MSIGERIRTLRTEKKISQVQLAKALDVSRQAVSKWENDLANPDTLKLIQLAEILETGVEYLATGVNPACQSPAVAVNPLKETEKVVEVTKEITKIVEKPVIKKVIRVKYLRNPLEFAILGLICFAFGLFLGYFL